MIAEANICPLVVPFYHLGMDFVLPNQPPYVPQMNQKVSIYVGEPLIFDELVQRMKKENRSLVRADDRRIFAANLFPCSKKFEKL